MRCHYFCNRFKNSTSLKIPKDCQRHYASTDISQCLSVCSRLARHRFRSQENIHGGHLGHRTKIKSICLRIQKFNEIENRLIIFSSVYSPVLVIHNPSTFFIARPTSVIQKASFFPDGCGVC